MAKSWVDITTIDNTVPFMKVRWKGSKWKNGSGPDCWFSEASGLTTDNMSWNQGTKDYGWYSAHRMNGGGYRGYPIYGCSFNFDHTQSGYWDVSGQVYRDHIKDTQVTATGFYDTTVVINNETYYEVDFSLWVNASGYSLYMPYANPTVKWSPGDIYVEIDTAAVVIEPSKLTFDSTGGTQTTTLSSSSDWTALYDPNNWYHISPSAGTSGDTVVSVSVDNYTDTTADRRVDITFENVETKSSSLSIRQKKVATGGVGNVFLGDFEIEGCYLGDYEVEACYLGDDLIFPTGQPQPTPTPTGFTMCGLNELVAHPGVYYTFGSKYSDNKWYVPTTQISGGTGIASEVTYNNGTISNLPSDLLVFELESYASTDYLLKQVGTNNYLHLNGKNIELSQTPTVFEFATRILDSGGNVIGLLDNGIACRPEEDFYGVFYTGLVNTYVSGDPDPLYAREFMFDNIDSSTSGFVAKLFKAN